MLYSIDEFTVHHTIDTAVGHSGSPIIVRTSEGKPYVIGIHTHKGISSSFNSGLYFDSQIEEKFKTYQG